MDRTIRRIEKIILNIQADFIVLKTSTASDTRLRKERLVLLGEKSDELSSLIQSFLKFGEDN